MRNIQKKKQCIKLYHNDVITNLKTIKATTIMLLVCPREIVA